MQYIRTFVLVLFPMLLFSQDFSNQWTGHFSYFNIKDLYATQEKIYAASENAVFIYDIASGNSETFSTINGLSGENVTTIYHSEAFDVTLIGYENGLLEVLVDETNRTFIDIVDKPTISPTQKRINNFYENGNIVYIATEFGIVEFNLEKIEFGDTFFIGPGGSQINITGITLLNGLLFASTRNNGVLSANSTSPNLVDFNQWSTVTTGNFDGILTSDTTLLVWQNATVSTLVNGTLSAVITAPSPISDVRFSIESLLVNVPDQVLIFDQNYLQTAVLASNPENAFVLNTSLKLGETLYLGTRTRGLLEVAISNPMDKKPLSPQGPLQNDPFALQAQNNNLWVVYGDYDVSFNPFPLKQRGISRLNNGVWQNIPKTEVLGATSLCDIAVNPANEEQVFISSYQDGLLEINNNEVTKLYNTANSDFETLVPGEEVVRLNGMVFDEVGDLWITNNRTGNALKRFNPETEEIFTVNLPSTIIPSNNLGYSETVIDNDGNVFTGSDRGGVVAYNPDSGALAAIVGESSNLPSNIIKTLEIDRNNQLWIGTFFGLRVLFNPSEVFQGGNARTEQIIIRDDEGVPQELLFGQTITDIEADGSNNKWVGTSASGVFYFSPDGEETLLQFTTDNSPLPSNNILDIVVDDSTGAVFFATEKGLLEFKGTATGPEETLTNVQAFPNPVRPGFNGRVTIKGLTSKATVKITDIEGNLVYEEISEGGSIQWDTTAFGRHKVATGVYLILITAEDQVETTVSKLLIVR